jgi:hypothetical protein
MTLRARMLNPNFAKSQFPTMSTHMAVLELMKFVHGDPGNFTAFKKSTYAPQIGLLPPCSRAGGQRYDIAGSALV